MRVECSFFRKTQPGVRGVKLFGIRVEDPAVKTVIVRSKGSSGDRLVIGPGGIRLAEGKICS